MKRIVESELVYLVVVILFSSVFVFYRLGQNHLIEFDEAIYGLVSKNILKTGDWFTLQWRLNVPWFDKGPFYLWLTALSLKFFGLSSFAVRFWSAVFAVLGCLGVFWLGKTLYGLRVGFLAAIVLASTTGYLYYGRNGMLDVANATFNSFSLLILLKSLDNQRFLPLAAVVLALGFSNRGLLAFLALLSFIIFVASYRKLKIYGAKTIFTSLLVFLAVILPWHLVETWRHGWNFWQVYLGHQMFLRFSQTIEGKSAPLFWYVTVARTHFRIWFVVFLVGLPFILYRLLKRDKRDLLVVIWSAITFLVLTLSRSKLIWYAMPLYPPLALMTAQFIDYFSERVEIFLRVKIRNFLPLFILLLGGFYNVLVWERIQPKDFTFDQVKLIERKNEIDQKSDLLVAGYYFYNYSVSAFYSQSNVVAIPKEELKYLLDGKKYHYAIITLGDLNSLPEKDSYKVIHSIGDGALITL